MSAEPNEMVAYAELIAADPGPQCPECHRDRGSHTMFCSVPGYMREREAWHNRIAEQMADHIWPESVAPRD